MLYLGAMAYNHFMASCMVFLLTSGPVGSNQGEPTLQRSKGHCGRCPVSVAYIGLALFIALVGVSCCLLPWPFANDWQDQMCSAFPLRWFWRHGGMYTGICWHAYARPCSGSTTIGYAKHNGLSTMNVHGWSDSESSFEIAT